MCNCKGWDINYYTELVDITPHFCRVFDDCGHIENSLEEAVDSVVEAYQQLYESYLSFTSSDIVEYDQNKADYYLFEQKRWKDRTHPSYLFYKEQEHDI